MSIEGGSVGRGISGGRSVGGGGIVATRSTGGFSRGMSPESGVSHHISISPEGKMITPHSRVVTQKFGSSSPNHLSFANRTVSQDTYKGKSALSEMKAPHVQLITREGTSLIGDTKVAPKTDTPKISQPQMELEWRNPALSKGKDQKSVTPNPSMYKVSADSLNRAESLKNLKVEAKNELIPSKKDERSVSIQPGVLTREKLTQEAVNTLSEKSTISSQALPHELATEHVQLSQGDLGPQPQTVQGKIEVPSGILNEAKKMNTENIQRVTEKVQKVTGTTSQPEARRNDANQLLKKYVAEYIEPKAAGGRHDIKQTSVIEQILHPSATVSPKEQHEEGKIKRDAKHASIELGKNADEAQRVLDAYTSYLQSINADTPENQSKGMHLALEGLHFANERTGTEDAAVQAYEMTSEDFNSAEKKEADSKRGVIEDVTADPKESPDEELATNTKTDRATLNTRAVEAEALEEEELSLKQPEVTDELQLEDVTTPTAQQQATQQQGMIQVGDVIEEEVVQPKFVEDEITNSIRRSYALGAAEIIFDARQNTEISSVSGREIVDLMPEAVNQTKAVKSSIVEDVQIDDGSYKRVLADFSSVRGLKSVSDVDGEISQVIARNTAVTIEEETITRQRLATQEDVRKVYEDYHVPTQQA